MNELIFEWRDKTIVKSISNEAEKHMELMDYIKYTSSIRCFFGTEIKPKTDKNTQIVLNEY